MKLEIFTVLFNEWKLEKVLDYVSKLGYEAVKIACWKSSNHIDMDKHIILKLLSKEKKFGFNFDPSHFV